MSSILAQQFAKLPEEAKNEKLNILKNNIQRYLSIEPSEDITRNY